MKSVEEQQKDEMVVVTRQAMMLNNNNGRSRRGKYWRKCSSASSLGFTSKGVSLIAALLFFGVMMMTTFSSMVLGFAFHPYSSIVRSKQAMFGSVSSSSSSSYARQTHSAITSLELPQRTRSRCLVGQPRPNSRQSSLTQCQLFGLGAAELIVIGGAVLFVLGPSRIKDLAKGVGSTANELKNEVPKEFQKGYNEGQMNAKSRNAKPMEQPLSSSDDE